MTIKRLIAFASRNYCNTIKAFDENIAPFLVKNRRVLPLDFYAGACIICYNYQDVLHIIEVGSSFRYRTHHKNKQTNNCILKLLGQQSFTDFEEALPKIFINIFDRHRFLSSSGIGDHIKKITEYGSGGRNLSSALMLHTYQTLEDPTKLMQQAMYQAHVLAWAVEMAQLSIIISDDIQKEAKTRRGKPCWHSSPYVGLGAVNDQSLLRSFLYEMLKVTFEHNPSYGYITELFNKAFIYTEIGQYLDHSARTVTNRNYLQFTMDLYLKIVYYKTQFSSVQLPVLLGMVLANRNNAEFQQHVQNVCADISLLFQMQEDYLDCFGNKNVTDKMGTDIQEGKCSWLAVTALDRCTKPQHIVFKVCYGSKEPAHVERIKRLYEQLQIPIIYKEEEKALYKRIMHQTHKEHNGDKLPAEIFIKFLNVLN